MKKYLILFLIFLISINSISISTAKEINIQKVTTVEMNDDSFNVSTYYEFFDINLVFLPDGFLVSNNNISFNSYGPIKKPYEIKVYNESFKIEWRVFYYFPFTFSNVDFNKSSQKQRIYINYSKLSYNIIYPDGTKVIDFIIVRPSLNSIQNRNNNTQYFLDYKLILKSKNNSLFPYIDEKSLEYFYEHHLTNDSNIFNGRYNLSENVQAVEVRALLENKKFRALDDYKKIEINPEKKTIFSMKFPMGLYSSKFEIPIFIKALNISYTDFEPSLEINGFNIRTDLIDLENDGIPEYVFFIANTSLDISNIAYYSNQPFREFEYNDFPPLLKYENQTVIERWEICYQKEKDTNAICGWKDIENSDFQINLKFFPVELRNRFDVYTIGSFDTSPEVMYFCPLALDLGTWPKEFLYFIRNESMDNSSGRAFYSYSLKLDDYVIDNRTQSSLILIGLNKSIIITKPSLGILGPSPDYFFKTELLSNGHVRAAVCTINHNDKIIPPKGPNSYIVFGEPNDQELMEMSSTLENIKDPVLYPPKIIQIDFIKGNVWFPEFSRPEIRPHIELKTDNNYITALNFTWMTQLGKVNENVYINNGVFIFEKPILLTDSRWRYPFDKYDAIIHIEPRVIQNADSSLSFDADLPYEGKVKFENGKIIFRIERTLNSKIKYFLGLIAAIIIIIAVFLSKLEIKSEILNLLVTFLAIFITVDEILSIGSIPYVIMIVWFVISYFRKKKD